MSTKMSFLNLRWYSTASWVANTTSYEKNKLGDFCTKYFFLVLTSGYSPFTLMTGAPTCLA